MQDRFTDRTVLITGAASGIGRATALRLAAEGARLALVDIDEQRLADSADAARKTTPGTEVFTVVADVCEEADVHRYVEETLRTYGGIDGFFNNADGFVRTISVNLTGVFLGLKHVLKTMREQGHGAVVNTASALGLRANGNGSDYHAAKHGVIGLTRNSGVEYGRYGITVNAIAPGSILTPMLEEAVQNLRRKAPEELSRRLERIPVKRFGQPQEVAALAAFLLSDEARYINATVVTIDGGRSEQF
jgi:NAD(P)-dependent dehydrogenase (short-subunit alcohol dehydrogenase family)